MSDVEKEILFQLASCKGNISDYVQILSDLRSISIPGHTIPIEQRTDPVKYKRYCDAINKLLNTGLIESKVYPPEIEIKRDHKKDKRYVLSVRYLKQISEEAM